jgi:carboxyl-terminal processing protease
MNKRTAVILAVTVGVICSLATFLLMTFLKGTDPFLEIEQVIQQKYLHDYNMEDLQNAGLKAVVAKLGDPYSVYYTPDEYQHYTQQVSGEYVGIGMTITKDETTGLARVESFLEGSPAKEVGVEEGDLIVSINGEDVTGKTLQEISEMCVGDEGTKIKLGVKRVNETLEFELVRKAISRDMVVYKMLSEGIGYMRILQFGGNCEDLFGEAMDYFQQNGAQGVVIDLRDDPGGYLSTVVNILNKLLPEGTLVYTEDKNGNRVTYSSDASCIKMPLTLIVNENTASAAEIFAGAIQDYNYGKVVGTTTYGKGVVQEIIPVKSTGGGIKITVSQYFTPSGRTINGNGIYPDYYVGDSSSNESDAQLAKAVEVLKDSIAAGSS